MSGAPVDARDSAPDVSSPTGPDSSWVGQILDGRFRILRRLGAGGFGTVYAAEHLTLGHTVAIKLLAIEDGRKAAELRERFLREARLGAAAKHPNVVAIHDFGLLESGAPFMVMDHLEGRSMALALSCEWRWSPQKATSYFAQMLSGLAALHDLGIVHRDLKPENVFLVRDEYGELPVLLDFGISHSLGLVDGLESPVPTREGFVPGTPSYMSPEQARGGAVDTRSDAFSVGVMLYEALAGELPFVGETVAEIVRSLVHDTPRPLESLVPEVPAPLAAFVHRALSSKPEDRFDDARAMRAALRQAADACGHMATVADELRFRPSGVRCVIPPAPAVSDRATEVATVQAPPAVPRDLPVVPLWTWVPVVLGVAGALVAVGWAFLDLGRASYGDPVAAEPVPTEPAPPPEKPWGDSPDEDRGGDALDGDLAETTLVSTSDLSADLEIVAAPPPPPPPVQRRRRPRRAAGLFRDPGF